MTDRGEPELGALPLFHRVAGQKVLVLGDGEAAEPKRRLVERAGAVVIDDSQRAIDEGVRIAFVAYEDRTACEAAAIRLRCAGMLVNVVDRPDLCDFTTPSILDRNPLLVAIGTGGASAGLAKHVRLRLERLLPQSLGRLARSLFAGRDRLRAQFPDGASRRRAIDQALAEGGPLDPLDEGSADRVDAWLSESSPGPSGRVHTITLGSDDPEELTVRDARLLGMADRLVIDSDVPPQILARARADAERRIVAEDENVADTDGLTVILRWSGGTESG